MLLTVVCFEHVEQFWDVLMVLMRTSLLANWPPSLVLVNGFLLLMILDTFSFLLYCTCGDMTSTFYFKQTFIQRLTLVCCSFPLIGRYHTCDAP